MKRFIAALCATALAFAMPMIPASAEITGPIYCNAAPLSGSISTATTTSLLGVLSGSSAMRFLCGYTFYAGAGASGMTVQLEYGTGAACSNPTVITPAIPVAASTIQGDNSAFWRGLLVPPNNGLCAVTTGTVAVTVQVFIAQQ